MAVPQSLLHGPGRLCLSCPHCALGANRAVILPPPAPLTLCLARIQSSASFALALGKHLSVWPEMWSRLALCHHTSGRTAFSYYRPRAATLTSMSLQGGRHRQALSFPTALQGNGHLILLQTAPSVHPLHPGVVNAGRFCTVGQSSREGTTFSNCRLRP